MQYRVFSSRYSGKIEWPTIALVLACSSCWAGLTWLFAMGGAYVLLLPALIYATTLHSSLQHEAVHGHPTDNRLLNEALVFPALGLLFPYQRFRSLHLKHHNNARLTDPLDDPESFYLTRRKWAKLPLICRGLLNLNNTFSGRLLLGPVISVTGLLASDLTAMARGDLKVARAWLLHACAIAPVLYWLQEVCGLSLPAYLLFVAYPAMSLLMVRTFAEHRAHKNPDARSIIVESNRVMSLLFLNNNLHAVHHQYPAAPWYQLSALFHQHRAAVLARNGHYYSRGYGQLAGSFLVKPKETVPHPLDHPARENAG